jgi:hypothetical protein
VKVGPFSESLATAIFAPVRLVVSNVVGGAATLLFQQWGKRLKES